MSVMNLLMIESLSFVRALAAHVDQLRELMGEGWPDFIAKLEQVLGKICKADTDTRVLLLVDEIFDVGLEEPAGSLVRSLHKQAAERQAPSPLLEEVAKSYSCISQELGIQTQNSLDRKIGFMVRGPLSAGQTSSLLSETLFNQRRKGAPMESSSRDPVRLRWRAVWKP